MKLLSPIQIHSLLSINAFDKRKFVLDKLSQKDFSFYHRSDLTIPVENFSYVYILNNKKSRQWYLRMLDINNEDQRLFSQDSKRIRQLTIYEMTKQQSINLTYFFPWIHVLIIHVKTTEWLSLSIDWLYHLLTNMTSLFSLTIYHPKDLKNEITQDLLGNTLLDVKKHFFIKCNDGVLTMWF